VSFTALVSVGDARHPYPIQDNSKEKGTLQIKGAGWEKILSSEFLWRGI
jgi:hypothetical protein